MFIIINFIDSYRNIFIAMNQKILATAFEMSALVISVTFGYLLGCTLNYGIWAVEFVYLGSVVLLFMEYHLYFKFGSGFAEYRYLIAEDIVEDCYMFEDGLVDKNQDAEPILISSCNKNVCVEKFELISKTEPKKDEMVQKD